MGGEKLSQLAMGLVAQGSPPRGRGKVGKVIDCLVQAGITPAWAGKRPKKGNRYDAVKDHPRVGGEKIYVDEVLPGDTGSPPRRQGKAN